MYISKNHEVDEKNQEQDEMPTTCHRRLQVSSIVFSLSSDGLHDVNF
jgi:hypothetical protein